MRLDLSHGSIWSTVVSAGRAEGVATYAPRLPPSTWYVPEPEVAEYRSQGVLAEPEPGRGPSAARNAALDAAPSGCPVVVFDDDPLETPRFLVAPRRTVLVDPSDAVDAVLGVMQRTGASLGGVNDSGNAAWADLAVTQRFIGNVIVVAAGSDLRFDEDLGYAEDQDYCAQHLVHGSGLARLDYILWRFRIGSADGVTARVGPDGWRATAAILAERWPGIIVDDGQQARFRRPRASA